MFCRPWPAAEWNQNRSLGCSYETTIAGVVTRLLYDGDTLVAEYNGADTLIRRYVHKSETDEPLVEYPTNSTGAGLHWTSWPVID